jgi:shikimate dehydrogenase
MGATSNADCSNELAGPFLRQTAQDRAHPMDGHTRLIAHIGHPTGAFKAPLIYNPYFESLGVNAAVVPMGVTGEAFAVAFPQIMQFTNVDGALITMPHKVAVVAMLDEVSTAVKVAGSCNAVRRSPDGRLIGDMFDGVGFVRGVLAKGRTIAGASALIVGSGGVGSAIAAALAEAGVARLALHDSLPASTEGLADRLRRHFPSVLIETGSADPAGHDIVVNATPLGMGDSDPCPIAIDRIAPTAFVGDVVMKRAMTPLLAGAASRGCQIQIGVDMLFEQIPAYLAFFGFPQTTPEHLRELARITY